MKIKSFFWGMLGIGLALSGGVNAEEIRINTGTMTIEKSSNGQIRIDSEDIRLDNSNQPSSSSSNSSWQRFDPYYPSNTNHCRIHSSQEIRQSSPSHSARVYRSRVEQQCH